MSKNLNNEEIKQKIIYGDNIELEVTEIYPFMYQYNNLDSKNVLRIKCSIDNSFEDKIKPLMTNTKNIKYYETKSSNDNTDEYELKTEYLNYTRDFICNVNSKSGEYEIELTRLSDTDCKVSELQAQMDEIVLLLAEEIGA